MRHRQQLVYRITSSRNEAQTCEAVCHHLRSPLALLWWNIGIKPRDRAVGLCIGNRFYARPVPADMPVGRFIDSLVIRGRVITNAEGVCEVDVRARPSRITRVAIPTLLAVVGCMFLLAFIVTGIATLLIGVACVAAMGLFNAVTLYIHRDAEQDETKLLERWIGVVSREFDGVITNVNGPRPTA